MPRSENQKLKVLYILRLLAGTDASHVITMKDILEELSRNGISAERKRIYDDLEALRMFGIPVVGRRGRMAGYYLESLEEAEALLGLTVSRSDIGKQEAATCVPVWYGEGEKVELLCSEETAGSIRKLLGEEISVKVKGGKKGAAGMVLKFRAKPDSDFYGWLTGYGLSAKLLAPQSVIREYRKYLKEIRSMYKEN